ncbi:hypothetical protein CAC42_3677 [Sphaceloma murrayae]|uniref:NmrA-like domain-containing protein n=1 Tax=Sphaceloma murrayae TaxID=2082308 RepID=A0A2K1QHI6_9PEZI|nr:hypothetical protein CAC42_3677 [Sphaceloma murrayae]
MIKPLLITGATGQQGGSAIDALMSSEGANEFMILAVTRNAEGSGVSKLLKKFPDVRIVVGNLDNVPELFQEATAIAGQDIWGVYSVQVSMGPGVTLESEVKQGTDLIAESVRRGVSHFVYSSVERGGDAKSWDNETPVEHFKSKLQIEQYLRTNAGDMSWTILRPVAFMDNLKPGLASRVFLTAMRDAMHGKVQYWIALSDIGAFTAKAFLDPKAHDQQAIGLAGDKLTFDELQQVFAKLTAAPPSPSFSILGSILKYMVPDLGRMLDWFGTEGYEVDIESLRRQHSGLKTFERWIKEESPFHLKNEAMRLV